MSFRPKVPESLAEHLQLVYCPECRYAKRITVQNRRGTHACGHCDGEMEVYEPRPQRWGSPVAGFTGDGLHAALRRKGLI